MQSRILTAAQVQQADRGDDGPYGHAGRFRELFNEEVLITEALVQEYLDKFDWDWCALWLLSDGALKAYEVAIGPAESRYASARDSLHAYARGCSWYETHLKKHQLKLRRARAIEFVHAFSADAEGGPPAWNFIEQPEGYGLGLKRSEPLASTG